MATAKPAGSNATEITIARADQGTIDFCIIGRSPLIMNRMSQKAWFELLAPKGKKTTVEKASSLKHDPIKEFRDSVYRLGDDEPTLLALMSTAFKGAMRTAALDMPGAKKSQIGRLVYIPGEFTPIFGIPKVFMAITRSADMNKTPDVRTRAILPEWACRLSVTYTRPMLREQSIANLLAAAGFQSGVGDWRQEKGSGSFGSFDIVSADDVDFVRIMKQGRNQQIAALETPEPYNDETSEMLAWFNVEIRRRGFQVAA